MNILEWEKKIKNIAPKVYDGIHSLLLQEYKQLYELYEINKDNRDYDGNVNAYRLAISRLDTLRELERNKIRLEDIGDNIVLWSVGRNYSYGTKERFYYFYSDIFGNILFNGHLFQYATPFSFGNALVCDYWDNSEEKKLYIINIVKHKKITVPFDLPLNDLVNLINFRNNNIILRQSRYEKWGGYSFNSKTLTFAPSIPFIWSYLAVSRDPKSIYGGIPDRYYNIEGSNYSAYVCDTLQSRFGSEDDPRYENKYRFMVTRMPIKHTGDLGYINLVNSVFNGIPGDDPHVYGIEDMPFYMYDHDYVPNPGDKYYGEKEDDTLCTLDEKPVNVGSFNNYKRVLSKITEK